MKNGAVGPPPLILLAMSRSVSARPSRSVFLQAPCSRYVASTSTFFEANHALAEPHDWQRTVVAHSIRPVLEWGAGVILGLVHCAGRRELRALHGRRVCAVPG